ncbi:MAG: FHA domain-containing protein [Candidatus Limnocylindrales bacterium]
MDRPLRIGRDPGCDVVLADPTVSRRHAVVSVPGGQPFVDASTSTNGIQLDRGRADRAALGLGQVFSIGATAFRVVQTPAAQPALAQPGIANPNQWAPPTAGQPAPGQFAPGQFAPTRAAVNRQAPARARATAGPAIVMVIVAVAVVGAVVGAAVLHPFGGQSLAQSTPAPGASQGGWEVSAGAIPSDAPPGMADAIESFAPPAPVFGLGFVVETVRAEGDWAIVFGHAVAGPSDSNIPTETIVVIAQRTDTGWQTVSNRDEGFCAALNGLPAGIMNATERSFYGCG